MRVINKKEGFRDLCVPEALFLIGPIVFRSTLYIVPIATRRSFR